MNTILDVIGHLMNVEAVFARGQSADLSREHQLAVWLLWRGNMVIVICIVIPIVVVIIIILNTFVIITIITCCNTIVPFNSFSNAQCASSPSLWGIIIMYNGIQWDNNNVIMKKKKYLPSACGKREGLKKRKRKYKLSCHGWLSRRWPPTPPPTSFTKYSEMSFSVDKMYRWLLQTNNKRQLMRTNKCSLASASVLDHIWVI